MSRWPMTSLAELCVEIDERQGAREFPVYSVSKNHGIIPQAKRFKKRVASENTNRYKVIEPGDFAFDPMLLWSGSVARNEIGHTGIVSPAYTVFRARPAVRPELLLAFLRQQSRLPFYESISFGTNARRRKAHFKDFVRLEMPLPPLAEQERIVRLLDEADTNRKLRAQADQRTADLIPALFHEMFGDPVTNPMGWNVQPVRNLVADLQGGRNIASAGENEQEGGYRVLKVSAVTSGTYRPEESKPLPPGYQPPAGHIVRPGDLLFSRANTTELVGATCHVGDTPPNLLLPDKLWRFVWKDEAAVCPLYMLALLQSRSIRRKLSKLSSGSGGSMKNISKAKLMGLQFPVPSLEHQLRFALRTQDAMTILNRQRDTNQILESLTSNLLQLSLDYSVGVSPADIRDQLCPTQ